MAAPRETVLAALHARLSALAATALRGEVLPEWVQTEGLLIMWDGDSGEPEVTVSPLANYNQHRAENRYTIAKEMSQEAIEKAQAMARECMASDNQDCGY